MPEPILYGIVYGLYDPRTGELRYIGQTTSTLKRRLSSHLSRNELSKRRHVTSWLKQLKWDELAPRIEQLAKAYSKEELDSLEIAMIAEARLRGDRLTNHTEGGRGMKGFTISEETRAKVSASNMGHVVSPGTRAKISAANKGKIRSSELKKQWTISSRSEKTIRQIASVQGVAIQTATKTAPGYKRNGFSGSNHPLFREGIQTELIISDLQSGMSRKQVAEKYEVTPRFIGKRLRQAERAGVGNVPKSNRGIPTEVILQRLGKGLSRAQVAESLGISTSLVILRLRQYGGVNA